MEAYWHVGMLFAPNGVVHLFMWASLFASEVVCECKLGYVYMNEWVCILFSTYVHREG